jgi:hypothetical protein
MNATADSLSGIALFLHGLGRTETFMKKKTPQLGRGFNLIGPG